MTAQVDIRWTETSGLFELMYRDGLMCTQNPLVVVGRAVHDSTQLTPPTEDDLKWCTEKGLTVKYNPELRLAPVQKGDTHEIFVRVYLADGEQYYCIQRKSYPSRIILHWNGKEVAATSVLQEDGSYRPLTDEEKAWCQVRSIGIDDGEHSPISLGGMSTSGHLYTSPSGHIVVSRGSGMPFDCQEHPFTAKWTIDVKEQGGIYSFFRPMTTSEREWCRANGIELADQCTAKDEHGIRCKGIITVPDVCQGCIDKHQAEINALDEEVAL